VKSASKQRKKQRYKYEAVIWHSNILPGVLYKAKIRNLGRSGLYFETDQPLYTGEQIHIARLRFSGKKKGYGPDRLAIKWQDKNAKYFDPVVIRWRKELADSPFRFGYGAAFVRADSILANMIVASATEKQINAGDAWENRKDPRQLDRENYRRDITFSLENKSYKGIISNISRMGAFIETNDTFSLGQIIKLSVPGDGFFKPLELDGCVVRVEPGAIGVRFDKRSGRERRKDIDRRTGADRRGRRGRRDRRK
jgi:hypothetical protein